MRNCSNYHSSICWTTEKELEREAEGRHPERQLNHGLVSACVFTLGHACRYVYEVIFFFYSFCFCTVVCDIEHWKACLVRWVAFINVSCSLWRTTCGAALFFCSWLRCSPQCKPVKSVQSAVFIIACVAFIFRNGGGDFFFIINF